MLLSVDKIARIHGRSQGRAHCHRFPPPIGRWNINEINSKAKLMLKFLSFKTTLITLGVQQNYALLPEIFQTNLILSDRFLQENLATLTPRCISLAPFLRRRRRKLPIQLPMAHYYNKNNPILLSLRAKQGARHKASRPWLERSFFDYNLAAICFRIQAIAPTQRESFLPLSLCDVRWHPSWLRLMLCIYQADDDNRKTIYTCVFIRRRRKWVAGTNIDRALIDFRLAAAIHNLKSWSTDDYGDDDDGTTSRYDWL